MAFQVSFDSLTRYVARIEPECQFPNADAAWIKAAKGTSFA